MSISSIEESGGTYGTRALRSFLFSSARHLTAEGSGNGIKSCNVAVHREVATLQDPSVSSDPSVAANAKLFLNSLRFCTTGVHDSDHLVEAAGRMGYLFRKFYPVHGAIWNDAGNDLTLERGGYRNPSCPADSVPVEKDCRSGLAYCMSYAAYQA